MLKFLSILRNFKISFKTPKHHEILVFDNLQIHELRYVLRNRNYFVLDYRVDSSVTFFISLKVIKNVIKFYKGDIYTAYLSSIISIVNPKVVLTFIDNSLKFYELNRIFQNRIEFIAIQNAGRSDIPQYKYEYKKGLIKYDFSKKIFLTNFLCFGSSDVYEYKKNKARVKHFYKVGSLRLSNYLKDCKTKNKKKFDICLISDLPSTNFLIHKIHNVKKIINGYVNLINYTIKFCKKNNKKLIFARKDYNNYRSNDKVFLKEKLSKQNYSYLMKNSVLRKNDQYSSYKAINYSDVVVGVNSTMLFEKISLGGKILSCNFTKSNILDFPLKNYLFLKKNNYSIFENRLKNILKVSEKKFFSHLKSKKNFLIESHKKKNTIKEINKIIDKKLKK